MGLLYLVAGKEEVDRRRQLVGKGALVEAWQDLYAPDIPWIGDDAIRRLTYAKQRDRSASPGLVWMGEESKGMLDGVGQPLRSELVLPDEAVPVYYGPRLADLESLPSETSLRARVLSAHGIAVAWVTYDQSGERTEYQPTVPTDPTFYLRRPGGRAAHLWRLFRTRPEAVTYMAQHFGNDPEAQAWAEHLAAEDFEALVERFGRRA